MLLAVIAFWFGNAEQAGEPIACLFSATHWEAYFTSKATTMYTRWRRQITPYQAARVFLQLLADVYVREPSRYDKRQARINRGQPLHLSHEPRRAH